MKSGRINKLFGTDGGAMLSLYADFPDDFDPATMPMMVVIDSLEVPLWCEKFERRGRSGAVATFADMESDRRAGELLGLEFTVPDTDDGEDDEFYMEDLIGFAVEVEEITGEGVRTAAATLTDYYDSEANPLFEIEVGERTVLVPAAEEFIAHIDFEGERIKMVLPEGLLDL